MCLQKEVQARVCYVGSSRKAQQFLLLDLLDYGRDVLEFMRLHRKEDVETFYFEHKDEIEALCEGDEVFITTEDAGGRVKLAIEKVLMEIEVEYDLERV